MVSSPGVLAKPQLPLDFLVIADHAENMGLAPLAIEGDPAILATEFWREAHPTLSPNDEFADFENRDVGALNSPLAKIPDILPREYAREVYKRGMQYENKIGVNPFKFGLIGSTDSHTGLSTSEESQYFGKPAILEPAPSHERFYELTAGRTPNPEGKDIQMHAWQVSSSGLAEVWARENNREVPWDSLKLKEVYVTSGTRISVRVFGGFDFVQVDQDRPDFARFGYEKDVPMGGDLPIAPAGKAPGFLVQAMRDPNNANLDRIQIIMGWLDLEGEIHERIYDAAWSDEDLRKPGKDGRLPPVGDTVNVTEASWSDTIGDPSLSAVWTDPDFDARRRAFYYARVIEIPTPRWTAYDQKRFGIKMSPEVLMKHQERA